MATYVAAQAMSGVQARAVHAGVNQVYSIYSLTATLSAGDVIQMCKLPDGARVHDVVFAFNVNPGANADEYNVGTRATPTALIQSATCSANVMFRLNQAGNIGRQFTVSDDAANRFTMIEVTPTTFAGTGTKSGALMLSITYSVDQ